MLPLCPHYVLIRREYSLRNLRKRRHRFKLSQFWTSASFTMHLGSLSRPGSIQRCSCNISWLKKEPKPCPFRIIYYQWNTKKHENCRWRGGNIPTTTLPAQSKRKSIISLNVNKMRSRLSYKSVSSKFRKWMAFYHHCRQNIKQNNFASDTGIIRVLSEQAQWVSWYWPKQSSLRSNTRQHQIHHWKKRKSSISELLASPKRKKRFSNANYTIMLIWVHTTQHNTTYKCTSRLENRTYQPSKKHVLVKWGRGWTSCYLGIRGW